MRPNPGRQLLYVVITLAAIFGGYFGYIYLIAADAPPKKTEAAAKPSAPQPWYKKQTPPPTLITTPEPSLFPEIEEQKIIPPERLKAYEESLPRDIYVAPQPIKKAPVVPVPPVRATATETAALPAWQLNALAAPDTGDLPVIALVIDDMGVDVKRSNRISALAGPMTLSFLTYGNNLAAQTARAKANGHELMLHISMEPSSDSVDPGPNVLLAELDEAELRRRLQWGFGRFDGYTGVNNHMGSKFTTNEVAMRVVLEEIGRRGLLFLDSRTSGRTVGGRLARSLGVPFAERNVFIDNDNEVAAVNKQLAEVEALARKQGYAIAIGHPREATIRALGPWLTEVQSRGFRLVPLTTIVKRLN
ncbi:MAG: divergent polysaccharide deacetylase family protein [Alphaproteobacteria bacterium]